MALSRGAASSRHSNHHPGCRPPDRPAGPRHPLASTLALLLLCATAVPLDAAGPPGATPPDRGATVQAVGDADPAGVEPTGGEPENNGDAPVEAGANTAASAGDPEGGQELAPRFGDWLEQAAPFITNAERRAFLALTRDYQRDAFIDLFWRQRDPYPQTARNELRERFDERVGWIRSRFGGFEDDRARILLTHGPPSSGVQVRCTTTRIPAEIWVYQRSEQVDFAFLLVFLKARFEGPARVYRPGDRSRFGSMVERASSCLNGDALTQALSWIDRQGAEYQRTLGRVLAKPRPRSEEWLATFAAYSTDLPADAERLDARLEVGYPGRHDSRTVIQGLLAVDRGGVEVGEFAGYRSADFLLTGEVVTDGRLFESFRYKFGFAADRLPAGEVPLAFQRYLRPGDYTLILRLEDLNSHRFFRTEHEIVVPRVEQVLPAATAEETETARIFAEATAAIASGETALKIVPPPGGLLTGPVRIDTLAVGEAIDRVAFYLDGELAMTKTRPPYNVELDFGAFPRLHTLRVEALDAQGRPLADDEKLLNAGGNRFAVRLVEPRRGASYERSLRARAEVEVPEGRTVERVEIYLNEERMATLYQPPYVQPIALPPAGDVTYVRAVAFLPDGDSTEDLVFINAPEHLEEVDIQFVELYTTATDAAGRPVEGLVEGDFRVAENGVGQTIHRFELVRDLPIHTAVLIDNSGSMRGSLDAVRDAALSFFQQAISPRDRAAVVTFNKFPHLAVKLTNNLQTLGGGLAGLTAEGETALYDSVIFSLYYLAGIRGQRALLVLSDGKDEASRFGWAEAVEYARRAGVTIYTIGVGLEGSDARQKLAALADVTGGRAYFLADVEGLEEIYGAIQRELRSQYLIAYQSTNTGGDDAFRTVELSVGRPGVKVKTISGYYP